MFDQVQRLVSDLKQQFSDGRENLFELNIEYIDTDRLILSGRVLEEKNLRTVCQTAQMLASNIKCDISAVEVLRRPENAVLTVTTNLASLHSGPSFLDEQVSQLLFGRQVEILQKTDDWAFVRCDDGYLGWIYQPYLRKTDPLVVTHLVVEPVALLRSRPKIGAPTISRVFGGTFVQVNKVQAEWAQVVANITGWLPLADLRDLQALPHTREQRRSQMVADAQRLVGVPYLWGGVSAGGIDCSGFVQLIHRWCGLNIRRDADMQMEDGKPIQAEQMQAGDLAFFGEDGEKRSITHVALSLGGWKIMHSSRSRNGVYEDDIQQVAGLRDSFLGACTYL